MFSDEENLVKDPLDFEEEELTDQEIDFDTPETLDESVEMPIELIGQSKTSLQ